MAELFDPLTIRGVTLRNRVGVSPMCQYSAKEGVANDWHLVHLGSRAAGGAGLVIVEATAVMPPGRISPGDLGIWSDEQAQALARIARFIATQGAVPGIQLAHAGRKGSTRRPWEGDTPLSPGDGGWRIVAPSPIPFRPGDPPPEEMTAGDIAEALEAFRSAAVRAREAGFRWVELHMAHGYLAHSFYSPLSNHRNDGFGGSFEKRVRFPVEAAAAVRSARPDDLPLTVRLSCTDWVDGGWTLEDTLSLSARFKGEGVDLIDCSSGGLVPDAQIPVGPGYQVSFAQAVRSRTGIPTASVGMITEPGQADEIIREERADLVLLAREELRDPYWPIHAAQTLGRRHRVPVPVQYQRGF